MFPESADSHAFICEPFHNLVQHQILSPAGISFTARRAEGEEHHDFFASEDRWCRPVMARSGPDGGLWIADMYRYMIEHPEWLPAEGKAELMPHYRLGENHGRIYRVVSATVGRRSPVRLAGLNLEPLVAALDSPSDWQRDKVQQMLTWDPDRAAIPLLESLYRSCSLPQVRVQVLWTLQGLAGLQSSLLIDALQDDHPRVRQAALQLSENRQDAELIRSATAATLREPGLSSDGRLSAAMLLIRSREHRPIAVEALAEWLQPQIDTKIQTAVIAALGQTAEPRAAEILGEAWHGLTPALRAQALAVWMSRTEWTEGLLERVERRVILPSDLAPVQQSLLLHHPEEKIAERARRLFSSDQTSTPKEVVQRFSGALKLTGDPSRGERIYLKNCVSCHRRGDEGLAIGPDLATVSHHGSEKLLVNILDPNADIQPGYQVYNCLLNSGEVISGILTGETANSLTIVAANGTLRTVGREEIDQLRNLNISLMPEGLHQGLTVQDMADLIALLKQPSPGVPRSEQ